MGRYPDRSGRLKVAVLTGGQDLAYALGLTYALVENGASVDFVGSDIVDHPSLHTMEEVRFLNLRGSQAEDAPLTRKVGRVLAYYMRLIGYACGGSPRILHVLWNNKFELFDRTLLMLFYRLCGRRIVMTAHNVNAGRRDGRDSALNRWSLRVQYRLADHIFVHTEKMQHELQHDFYVPVEKSTVIPFGINEACPTTDLSREAARERLGLQSDDKVMLFFGQIAPYKGLEFLSAAFGELLKQDESYRLVVAGKTKRGHEQYCRENESRLRHPDFQDKVVVRIAHVPDDEVEVYFKAADVLVLPYKDIFQSGLPFLAYGFGLPVIVSDVGSLAENVVEGATGFVCRDHDPADLARVIRLYFASDLYKDLSTNRPRIRAWAKERHSWDRVAELTLAAYSKL